MAEKGRQGKGSSLIAFPGEYVAVDLETTGGSPRMDEIIEIGAARVRNGSIVDTYQQLVNPGVGLSPYVRDLTSITDEMLSGAPAIEAVAPAFARFLGDAVMVGHNIACFDSSFLFYTGERSGAPIANDFVDTMRIARKLHPDWSHHRLSDLREAFGIEDEGAHRALADSMATARALEAMREEAVATYGSVEAFCDVAARRSKGVSAVAESYSDIAPQVEDFDDSHPFYGKRVVVTGSLGGWTKRDAAQAVVDCGGTFAKSLTRATDKRCVAGRPGPMRTSGRAGVDGAESRFW